MTQSIDINYGGRVSRFTLTLIDRKRLHGFKRRIALDEQGIECNSALLTRAGRFLLSAGSTADAYLDANGDVVQRGDLVAVDAEGKPLPTLPATTGRPQPVEETATLEKFLNHVVTRVYLLETETLGAVLEKELRAGTIFQIPFRARASHTETPAFLLANDDGIFLVQAEACHFDFVDLEQTITETDNDWEGEETDGDAFAIEMDWEIDHADA
jgi:hypothetical protein